MYNNAFAGYFVLKKSDVPVQFSESLHAVRCFTEDTSSILNVISNIIKPYFDKTVHHHRLNEVRILKRKTKGKEKVSSILNEKVWMFFVVFSLCIK